MPNDDIKTMLFGIQNYSSLNTAVKNPHTKTLPFYKTKLSEVL